MSTIIGKAPQLVPVQLMALIYGKHTNVKALLLAERIVRQNEVLKAAGVKIGEFEQSTGLQQTKIMPGHKVLLIKHDNLNDFELLKQIIEIISSAPAYELEFEVFHRFPCSTTKFEHWRSADAKLFLKTTYDLKNTMPETGLQPAHLV